MAQSGPESAAELAARIRSGQLTPTEAVQAALRRVEDWNPALNAFVSLRAEEALAEARAMTREIAEGRDPGPLAGVPVGVKDLENVAGMVTSFGSTLYRNHVARRDSVQVARLRAAGAIVLGKTNTPEFGYTVFTKNRLYGVTRNPWDVARTPGGSSGGSAAAVAAGLVPLATGTDAGGSIRIPASHCGCFGLKPSLGRIPAGAFPGPRDLLCMNPISVPGPLTRTVRDAALYLDCVAGHDPGDPASLPPPGLSYAACLDRLPARRRIAFCPSLARTPVQSDVMDRAERAAGVFEELGHAVEVWDGCLPNVAAAWSALLNCDLYAQVCESLERGRQELGRSLVALLEDTRSFALADLLKAQGARTELNRTLGDLFSRYDLLLTPTVPHEAFAAEGPPPEEIEGVTVALLDLLGFAYPFNFSGHPAASAPAGRTRSGLPVGLQIVGPRHRDDLVLQAARAYEVVRPWGLPGGEAAVRP